MNFLKMFSVLILLPVASFAAPIVSNGPSGICSVIYTDLQGQISKHSPHLNRQECIENAIATSVSQSPNFKKAMIDFLVPGTQFFAGKVLISAPQAMTPICSYSLRYLGGRVVPVSDPATSLEACIASGLQAYDRQMNLLKSFKISFKQKKRLIQMILFPRNSAPQDSYPFSDN